MIIFVFVVYRVIRAFSEIKPKVSFPFLVISPPTFIKLLKVIFHKYLSLITSIVLG